MSRTASRISNLLHAAGLLLMVLHSGSAIAEDSDRSEWNDDRWVPSLALSIGFTSQQIEGSVESTRQVFGFIDFPHRPFASSPKYANSIQAGGLLEIQSPALPIPDLHPRIFFGGEISNVSSQRRTIAREGSPLPDVIEPDGSQPFSAIELLGRGSETTVDLDNIQFGAHIGISFPVQVGDWRISIKPSARYLKQELQFTGIVTQGRRGFDDAQRVPRSIPTNVTLLTGSDSMDLHAVGPGLEIEIEAGGVRSLAASIFISGGAYRVLSNESISFRDSGVDSNNSANTVYFATWSADIDPWLYRASVGMRIKWTGAGRGWLFGAL